MDFTNFDRAMTSEKWDRPLFPIKPDSDAADDWNRWLAKHGHPSAAQIAPKNAGEWGLPFRRPPSEAVSIEAMLPEKWARVFTLKAKGRANA